MIYLKRLWCAWFGHLWEGPFDYKGSAHCLRCGVVWIPPFEFVWWKPWA